MGQKVHPIGIRLGISSDWNSTWYADTEDYANYLNDDIKVRKFIKKELAHASVSRIHIDRPAKAVVITIHSARPGIVIGKKGEDVERLRRTIAPMLNLNINNVKINIAEIRKPELDAQLVAEECGSTAGAPCHVPSRHEARVDQYHATRCTGRKDRRVGSVERCRDRQARVVSRWACAVAHLAR